VDVLSDKRFARYEFEGGLKDEEVLGDLYDFLVCGSLFGAIMENQAAELGMRMSSMENATKNCGEVLSGLRLVYNRQRQAVRLFVIFSFF
jgi:ATP synthase F1 gamma subunit